MLALQRGLYGQQLDGADEIRKRSLTACPTSARWEAVGGRATSLDADVWEVSHHGSANGTNQAILDAITPQIATLGTGDPARTTGGAFTAFAFGHPREDAVDLILGSLTAKRPDIHVLAATGQKAFESIDVNEALYATGWDGTVVITGRGDGTYSVQTER